MTRCTCLLKIRSKIQRLSSRKATTSSEGSRRRWARYGWSQMEVVATTLLVAVVMVGAMKGYQHAQWSNADITLRAAAVSHAQKLLAEVVTRRFEEAEGTNLLGLDASESPSNRAGWDDVDDYQGYSDQSPAWGVSSGLAPWARTVEVRHVEPLDPTVGSNSRTGLKEVRVRVSQDGQELALLVGYVGATLDQELRGCHRWWAGRDDDRNNPPMVSADVVPRLGGPNLAVSFSAIDDVDPEGDALTYVWTLDGNEVATTRSGSMTLTNSTDATRVLSLAVTAKDVHGNESSDVARIVLLPGAADGSGADTGTGTGLGVGVGVSVGGVSLDLGL
ncbi:MAG: hypothetical protein KDA83_19450 [Planctomycetales bacterium]|nr:hypothetical protein [Planctomycetales bacterium]